MHPLEELDVTTRVVKRAQYEAFEFTVDGDDVQVRNCSHVDPSEHEYCVIVRDGLPVSCSCPADTRFDEACKHRVAVAIRPPILEAATAGQTQRWFADDGIQESTEHVTREPGDAGSEACADCLPDFPCWECFRAERN